MDDSATTPLSSGLIFFNMSMSNTGFSFIYLASQSPRRRTLLEQIGVTYQILAVNYSDELERPMQHESAHDYIRRVCQLKMHLAKNILLQTQLPLAPILVADTAVTLNNVIFGKPKDTNDAKKMLQQLAGQTHEVLTAIAILPTKADGRTFFTNPKICISRSQVKMSKLSIAQIRDYIAQQAPFDKAACFIERITGSYSGIMGLPIFETSQLLHRACVQF